MRSALTTSFDPVVKLQRPLQRIALAHPVTALEADDAPIFQSALDAIVVGPSTAGACMLGAGGRVSCMSACGGRWRVGEVRGVPATASRIWSDAHTGYALADGALYWWKRNASGHTCDPSIARQAKRVTGLPAIAALADPLTVLTGPYRHEYPRCALGTGGEVRCWLQDLDDGQPLELFDPMK